MIEDVFKLSGVAQKMALGATSSISNTQVEHGLSGYSYPGCIQLKQETSVEADTIAPIMYNLQVTEGNFLVVIALTAGIGGSTVSISDTLANTWTEVFPTGVYQVWYAQANATGLDSVSISGQSFGWFTTLIEVAGVDTFDSVSVGTVNPGIGATGPSIRSYQHQSAELPRIPSRHQPFYRRPRSAIRHPAVELHHAKQYNQTPFFLNVTSIQERIVNSPGSYTLNIPPGGEPLFAICMLGFKCSNPPELSRTCG